MLNYPNNSHDQSTSNLSNAGRQKSNAYFEDDEWIKMEGGMIVDELGFRYAAEVYWGQRAQNYWQVDWKIFEEEK